MKVLVGVDGSSNSFAAVAFVGRLIAPDRDELTLFFATPAMTFDDERLDVSVEQRARTVLSRNILDAALERLPEPWRARAKQKDSMDGSPSQALVDEAKQSGADLIVVGYHGTSTIVEEFLLGSVSRKVLHTAKVPVLVVKGGAADDELASSDQLRTLAAYDMTHDAEPIANTLKQFAWPPNSDGFVLTVVKPMFLAELPAWVKNHPRDPDVAAMAEEWKKEHERNLVAARTELERFRGMLPPCFAKEPAIVAEGRPAEQIIKTAKEMKTQLVVLGSSGSSRLERLLIGSTAEQVLASATSSVLVVR